MKERFIKEALNKVEELFLVCFGEKSIFSLASSFNLIYTDGSICGFISFLRNGKLVCTFLSLKYLSLFCEF